MRGVQGGRGWDAQAWAKGVQGPGPMPPLSLPKEAPQPRNPEEEFCAAMGALETQMDKGLRVDDVHPACILKLF